MEAAAGARLLGLARHRPGEPRRTPRDDACQSMVAAAPATGPTRPPASIEDFLWNVHSVLVATPGPLQLEQLKDAYSKHLGHKCAIERFLVVGDGGLQATLKRIPHIVSLYTDGGIPCVKATQSADANKQELIEADQSYRRELVKKNAQAKAVMVNAKAKATAKAPAAAPGAPVAPGALVAQVAPVAKAPTAAPAGNGVEATSAAEKRPAADAAAAEVPAKKPKTGGAVGDNNDSETLARMLVQGVVRVLQNRAKQGKGALPIGELEEEFKALWKVPFNLQQANETDAVTFLEKWPNKVEVRHEGGVAMVSLSKKVPEKAKAGAPAPKVASPPVAEAKKPAADIPVAKTCATAAKSPAPVAAKGAPAPKAQVPPPVPAAAVSKPSVPASADDAANGGAAIPKRPVTPSRPPATIEDFLWNMHSVVEAYGKPMPIDQMKDAYSKHLGHKCAVERFLVVGDGGLAATLKRIPHVVTVSQDKAGVTVLTTTQPEGINRDQLVQADQAYRKSLQQKSVAAKTPVAIGQAKAPAAAAAPAATPVVAPAAPAAATPAAAPAAKAPAAPAPQAAAAARPAADAAAGDAKRPRIGEDAETLAKMLIQGIVRVLQNRAKEGKGALPISNLEEEFKALWKVPFNLAQAGETDAVAFLQKWPNKVEVVSEGGQHIVLLAKKTAKASASAPATASATAATGSAAPAAPAAAPVAAAPAAATAAAPRVDDIATATVTAAAVALVAVPPKAPAAVATEVAAAPAPAAPAAAADAESVRNLPQLRQQAAEVLQAMKELVRKQEAIVAQLA